MTAPIGVLVMAHGTPSTLDDLEAFYTSIRRGRPPSPDQLAELRGRYEAIGGVSPLNDASREQLDAVRHALERAHVPSESRLGFKFAVPSLEAAAAELASTGVDPVVGVVLAPHFSPMSVGAYHARVDAALGDTVAYVPVRSWHTQTGYVHALADRVRVTLASLPDDTVVWFTAHSLPARIVAEGDPYPDQVGETAALVATDVGLQRWEVGWQSAGRTSEPWLGPDVLDVIRTTAAQRPGSGVAVCPCGFTSDHLETLYDLDIEASALATTLGVPFGRTAALGADPLVADAIVAAVLEALAEATS